MSESMREGGRVTATCRLLDLPHQPQVSCHEESKITQRSDHDHGARAHVYNVSLVDRLDRRHPHSYSASAKYRNLRVLARHDKSLSPRILPRGEDSLPPVVHWIRGVVDSSRDLLIDGELGRGVRQKPRCVGVGNGFGIC